MQLFLELLRSFKMVGGSWTRDLPNKYKARTGSVECAAKGHERYRQGVLQGRRRVGRRGSVGMAMTAGLGSRIILWSRCGSRRWAGMCRRYVCCRRFEGVLRSGRMSNRILARLRIVSCPGFLDFWKSVCRNFVYEVMCLRCLISKFKISLSI